MKTRLTPNQVTAMSLASGLAGAWLFSAGTWTYNIVGSLLFVLCYTLDNCDGEIARYKGLASEWGARFDDFADWAVDTAFFVGLGFGVWQASNEQLWWWFGVAASVGATIDYVVDMSAYLKKPQDPETAAQEDDVPRTSTGLRRPQNFVDWLIFIFHKLSRADFCIIVLGLSLTGYVWVLLPLAAVGAQVYWITDLFKRTRGWGY